MVWLERGRVMRGKPGQIMKLGQQTTDVTSATGREEPHASSPVALQRQ